MASKLELGGDLVSSFSWIVANISVFKTLVGGLPKPIVCAGCITLTACPGWYEMFQLCYSVSFEFPLGSLTRSEETTATIIPVRAMLYMRPASV